MAGKITWTLGGKSTLNCEGCSCNYTIALFQVNYKRIKFLILGNKDRQAWGGDMHGDHQGGNSTRLTDEPSPDETPESTSKVGVMWIIYIKIIKFTLN